MKPKFYYDEWSQNNFWLFIGWSAKNVKKYLKSDYANEVICEEKQGCTMFTEDSICMIWINRKTKDSLFYSILAHECFHAANFVTEKMGIKNSSSNDEPLAYLLSTLIRRALK